MRWTATRPGCVVVCAIIAYTTPALAGDWQLCGHEPKRLACIYDGDTLMFGREEIGLMGFDAPERGKLARCERERRLAERATLRLQQLFNRGRVRIERRAKDIYGQTPAIAYVNGKDVGPILIREGLAYAYEGGKRYPGRWCW